jgi:hypothetical protein
MVRRKSSCALSCDTSWEAFHLFFFPSFFFRFSPTSHKADIHLKNNQSQIKFESAPKIETQILRSPTDESMTRVNSPLLDSSDKIITLNILGAHYHHVQRGSIVPLIRPTRNLGGAHCCSNLSGFLVHTQTECQQMQGFLVPRHQIRKVGKKHEGTAKKAE